MPLPLCQLPSPSVYCTGIVTTGPSSSVCSVTYSAAASIVSAAPFVPSLEVMPMEPERKRRQLESPEDCQEMLITFEDLWAARKYLSQHTSTHPAPRAVALPASISAAPAPGPSIPAAGAGPSTPPGSLPSSWSAASSWLLPHNCLRSCWTSPDVRAAPARSPSVPPPSRHRSQSLSQHPSPGKWSPASQSPSRVAASARPGSACPSSTHPGLNRSSSEHSLEGFRRSSSSLIFLATGCCFLSVCFYICFRKVWLS